MKQIIGTIFVLAQLISFPLAADELVSDKKLEFYQALAEHWAPHFYHDANIISRADGDYIDLNDVLAALDYDGDLDFTNNSASLKAMEAEDGGAKIPGLTFKAELPYIIEDAPHYYYYSLMTYHVMDGKAFDGHAHDSEAIFMAIRKVDGKPYGELELFITNAHGIPYVYSPNPELQKKANAIVKAKIEKKYVLLMSNVHPFTDRFSLKHRDTAPEFTIDAENLHVGPRVFICQSSHASYGCNKKNWENGAGSGYEAFPTARGQEVPLPVSPLPPKEKRLMGYSVYNFHTRFISKYYPRNFAELSDAEKKELTDPRSKMFAGTMNKNTTKTPRGTFQVRQDLPSHLAGAVNTPSGANLMYFFMAMADYVPMAFGDQFHKQFDPDNKYIEPTEDNPLLEEVKE